MATTNGNQKKADGGKREVRELQRKKWWEGDKVGKRERC
jgi:hypothetical protein